MTLFRGTLIFLLFFATNSVAQKNPADQNCEKILKKAQAALQDKNFTVASSLFLNAEKNCLNFDQSKYLDLISSLKGAINVSENTTTKSKYIDTLVRVYDSAEKNNFYDQINDIQRAMLILKSSNPNYFQADKCFQRGIHKTGRSAGETAITLYYFNLYSCYLNAPKEIRLDYKRRLIHEYFMLTKWMQEDEMPVKSIETIQLYFNNTIRTCDDLLADLPQYLNSLSRNIDEKKAELIHFQTILEQKECTLSNEYAMVIDSLLSLEPTFELYIIRAELFQNTEDYSKEFSSLYFAKKLTKDENEENYATLLMAKSLYKSKNYMEAYRMSLQVIGSNKAEALKLAATCVLRHAPNCGATIEEQQLNLFYTLDLLAEAKKGGALTDELESELSKKTATKESLAKMGLTAGQSILLPCWNVTIILPK